MKCMSHVSSYCSAILSKTSRYIAKSSFYGFSTSSWKINFEKASVKTNNLGFMSPRFHFRTYSSRKGPGAKSKSHNLEPKLVMKEEKDAFFVVRKGDVVGVYKTFSDCQAQVATSVCDLPLSIYKGYSLPKDAEEYLVARGLRNAIYTITATDLEEDLFGKITPYPFQQPTSSTGEMLSKDLLGERSQDVMGSEIVGVNESILVASDPLKEVIKLDHLEAQTLSSDCRSCVVEFDGASKGNPGPAGAAAVLRSDSGRVICRVREGLGSATNNEAEYQAMILGLKYALKKGYTSVCIQGDSQLVCMQLQGLWKVKKKNLSILYEEAKELKDKFLSVKINHVLRELNSEADAQANLAVALAVGEVQEVCE